MGQAQCGREGIRVSGSCKQKSESPDGAREAQPPLADTMLAAKDAAVVRVVTSVVFPAWAIVHRSRAARVSSMVDWIAPSRGSGNVTVDCSQVSVKMKMLSAPMPKMTKREMKLRMETFVEACSAMLSRYEGL